MQRVARVLLVVVEQALRDHQDRLGRRELKDQVDQQETPGQRVQTVLKVQQVVQGLLVKRMGRQDKQVLRE